MKRGDLFRVVHPSVRDPKWSRVFVVVSRQVLIDSKFSTVICAPVYTQYLGLSTQVSVGVKLGLGVKDQCRVQKRAVLKSPVR